MVGELMELRGGACLAALDGNARALLLHHAHPPSIYRCYLSSYISLKCARKEPWIGSDRTFALSFSILKLILPSIPLACIYSRAMVVYSRPVGSATGTTGVIASNMHTRASLSLHCSSYIAATAMRGLLRGTSKQLLIISRNAADCT